jgi:hypothetical protein
VFVQTDPLTRLPVTLLASAAALLAAAATARAQPVLDPLKPCYVSVETAPGTYSSEAVQVHGFGFTPKNSLDILIDDEVVLPEVAVDAAGEFVRQSVPAPVVHAGARFFTVTVAEREQPYQTVSVESKVTALAVHVRPARARPSQRVRFKGRGFTDTGAIYAHYLRRGVLLRTVRLAKAPSGDCGTFTSRRPQFPFRPHRGTYLVQIDQHHRLTDDGPLVKLTIDVRRRPAT